MYELEIITMGKRTTNVQMCDMWKMEFFISHSFGNVLQMGEETSFYGICIFRHNDCAIHVHRHEYIRLFTSLFRYVWVCVCEFHTWIWVFAFFTHFLCWIGMPALKELQMLFAEVFGEFEILSGFFALASCCSFSTVYLVIVRVSRGKVKCKWI